LLSRCCAVVFLRVFFSVSFHHPALHSFPTRRSSDLLDRGDLVAWQLVQLGADLRQREPHALGIDDECHAPRRGPWVAAVAGGIRSEEHTSELQSREKLVCRLLLENKISG